MDNDESRDDTPGIEASPEFREILDAKPELLTDAATAMSGMGSRMGEFTQAFNDEVLGRLDPSDPDSVTQAADNASRLGREMMQESERLQLIDTAVSEAVGGSTPLAAAMNRFCQKWQETLQSLGDEIDRSAQQLRDSDESS